MASLEIDQDHSPDATVASPGGELYRDCVSVWSTIPLICPGKRNFSVCRSEAGWKLTREHQCFDGLLDPPWTSWGQLVMNSSGLSDIWHTTVR